MVDFIIQHREILVPLFIISVPTLVAALTLKIVASRGVWSALIFLAVWILSALACFFLWIYFAVLFMGL